jgi:hypothetical protein
LLKERINVDVLPAAFKIEYHNQKHPAVLVKFGSPMPGGQLTKSDFEYCFNNNIKQLNELVINGTAGIDLFRSQN